MDMSNYLANAIVNATVRGQSYTTPATTYLALFLSDPTKNATGTEVSGASYSRVPITMSEPVNGTSANPSDIEFATASTNWGLVTHVAIYDAISGGNMLYFTVLDDDKNIESGDVFKVSINNLSLNIQ